MSQLSGSGRAGSTKLRRLVDVRSAEGPVPDSVLERRFIRLLRRSKLPMPHHQYPIREAGRLLAVVDFAYPDSRLVVEVDGYRYHSGRVRWQQDLTRQNELTSRGWRVLRVTAEDIEIRQIDVVRALARALAE